MSVYFVAAISNPESIYAQAVEAYPLEAVYKLSDDKFFVHTEATSKDVSIAIGIRDGSTGSGIVLRVTTYNGRASSALWEWLSERLEK